MKNQQIMDGNEACATIAHKINDVIAIYPITPASPMGEQSDEFSARGKTNIFGVVPDVIEMQSEGGAAGVAHGSLQAGALTTTFTASQGLLLMIPDMYKIAGELTPFVIHVAARSLAAQALSIFGDHSDVMSARQTGFAILASSSVQEAMDMTLVTQATSLAASLPFMHFFDGFRTSHEVSGVMALSDDQIRHMLSEEDINRFRSRALSPDHPVIRGTSQNPDVYFQGRETVNPYYDKLLDILEEKLKEFGELTGRHYRLFEYSGHPEAENLIVVMGSGAETCEETVLDMADEKVGVLKVRLFRPFSAERMLNAIPLTVKNIAVLDRYKEPGAGGEALYKDVQTAFAESPNRPQPRIIGGRFGLSSKEFTPGMVRAIFANLAQAEPKNNFTIGINDDVSHTSLPFEQIANSRLEGSHQCLFYGLGSDGTVSANKNTVKIIGEETDYYVQGYFVYDSKKAGAVTTSHVRFSPREIKAAYLIGKDEATFVACHQSMFLQRLPMLDNAAPGAMFLINSPLNDQELWDSLPQDMQQIIIDKNIKVHVIDAYHVAAEYGMGKRINTIMQTCFFALANLLPPEEAIAKIKDAVSKTYGKKGAGIVAKNHAVIDASVANLRELPIPAQASSTIDYRPAVPADAPPFVQQVTAKIIQGLGDSIPVSQMPVDGSYPLGTAAYEKRTIADSIPVWDASLCIACGKCPFVCPHSAIRSKAVSADTATPDNFKTMPLKGKGFDNLVISYQVAPEDCTGCGLCVDVCPAKDKKAANHKALNMVPLTTELLEQEQKNWDYFLSLDAYDRTTVNFGVMKSAMLTDPLFEFSGACVGCGETPYVALATRLFGDRMIVANATGCSSIYGGNLPTTPYTTNADGKGPAWSNSLFEDNAEFGLGYRLAIDNNTKLARTMLHAAAPALNQQELIEELLSAPQEDEADIYAQRQRLEQIRPLITDPNLLHVLDYLVKKSVWIIGGDGWAYDIGFGGVDHVLASGRDVNILVLDTEVYSNTGGQTSKATPKGAVAKYSAAGKPSAKKDLGMIAMAYERVYVAQVAFGAKDTHTLKAFMEAEKYPGVSLIIAYSPCIAHGIDLAHNLDQQKLAVASGHWPLYRYDPRLDNPLILESKEPSVPLEEYYKSENRFRMLWRSHPELASGYVKDQQRAVTERYHHLKQLAGLNYKTLSVVNK
jgi:pyruvate-ferredoxin/flavodoxin oxidoreductase